MGNSLGLPSLPRKHDPPRNLNHPPPLLKHLTFDIPPSHNVPSLRYGPHPYSVEVFHDFAHYDHVSRFTFVCPFPSLPLPTS